MMKMRLEDAIVYVLATTGRGMPTVRIAEIINEQRLHVRSDLRPVSDRQIYAVVMRKPSIFTKEGAIIHLLM